MRTFALDEIEENRGRFSQESFRGDCAAIICEKFLKIIRLVISGLCSLGRSKPQHLTLKNVGICEKMGYAPISG